MLPCASTILAFVLTPTTVPMVSNISMNINVNTTTNISNEKIWLHSNWQKIGETESGREATPLNLVMCSPVAGSLITRPSTAVASMPMRSEPGTFFTTRMPVSTRPIRASSAGPAVMSPRATVVASFDTMTPAFLRPMKAMNRPIPQPMAFFNEAGMESTMSLRTLVTVRMMKMIPSRSTAVSANCQLYPIPKHTVNTKKALRPIPGANAKGFFA